MARQTSNMAHPSFHGKIKREHHPCWCYCYGNTKFVFYGCLFIALIVYICVISAKVESAERAQSNTHAYQKTQQRTPTATSTHEIESPRSIDRLRSDSVSAAVDHSVPNDLKPVTTLSPGIEVDDSHSNLGVCTTMWRLRSMRGTAINPAHCP